MKTFKDLDLAPEILKAVEELGYSTPTPIQAEAIPHILAGSDLRASAETGTGKTAAFILPAMQRLTVPSLLPGRGPRILVLVPTRELAMQVTEEAMKFSKYLSRAKTVCIYGGQPYPIQNRQLSRPYELLVATPGRLIDHMESGKIDFSRLEMFVLDEADRMLDMGFSEPVEHIAKALPQERQTLMFSATLNGAVNRLFKHQSKKTIEIKVDQELAQKANIEQRLHYVDSLNHKHQLLDHLLSDPLLGQTIVFTSTKRNADELADKLSSDGFQTAAIHGDLNQRQRTRTLANFREGRVRILIATDVAARGIDVQNITHVINFDLPGSAEDYVHRIGRTGRAGAKGTALSFAAHQESYLLKRIQQFTGQTLTAYEIPGLEPKVKPGAGAAHPARSRSGGRPANRSGRPGSFSGNRPGSFSENRSENRQGSRPGSFSENRSENRQGSRPGSFSENRSENRQGSRPGSFSENRSENRQGNRPGSFSENRSENRQGNRPGSFSENRSENRQGSRPGSFSENRSENRQGSRPGSFSENRSENRQGSRPGSFSENRSENRQGSRPGSFSENRSEKRQGNRPAEKRFSGELKSPGKFYGNRSKPGKPPFASNRRPTRLPAA